MELGMYITIYSGKGGSSPTPTPTLVAIVYYIMILLYITDFISQIAPEAISENANLKFSLKGHAHASYHVPL